MPWLKLLHIAALVIWCGSLLYLPALLSQSLQLRRDSGFAQGTPPMPRFFYISVATPAGSRIDLSPAQPLSSKAANSTSLIPSRLTHGWVKR